MTFFLLLYPHHPHPFPPTSILCLFYEGALQLRLHVFHRVFSLFFSSYFYDLFPSYLSIQLSESETDCSYEHFYRNKQTNKKEGEEQVTNGDNYAGCGRPIVWFAISFTLHAGVLKMLAMQFVGLYRWAVYCEMMLMQLFFARQ